MFKQCKLGPFVASCWRRPESLILWRNHRISHPSKPAKSLPWAVEGVGQPQWLRSKEWVSPPGFGMTPGLAWASGSRAQFPAQAKSGLEWPLSNGGRL